MASTVAYFFMLHKRCNLRVIGFCYQYNIGRSDCLDEQTTVKPAIYDPCI